MISTIAVLAEGEGIRETVRLEPVSDPVEQTDYHCTIIIHGVTNMPICFAPQTSFRLHRGGRAILFGVLLVALGACATNPAPSLPDAVVTAAGSDEPELPRWWYMRFRLARAPDDEVDSYLDALIADQIVAPVISQHQAELELWRFHRRWPDDATGHQFSFILFAPTPLAARLSAQIEHDPILRRLMIDGHLVEFRTDAVNPDRATDPAATSDTSWPPEIQREWPKFIMGASRMWLGLVQSEAAKHGDLDLYERYQAVEVSLDELWFQEANHAFFHHLSALFGYKPVRVIRRDIMTF